MTFPSEAVCTSHPQACNADHQRDCVLFRGHGCNGEDGKCPSGLRCSSRIPTWLHVRMDFDPYALEALCDADD